uniref:Uncharacterized protein n=1 Tax=Arundo donax TaxID=35708 RepID=A0A0A9ENU4_ARUDO
MVGSISEPVCPGYLKRNLQNLWNSSPSFWFFFFFETAEQCSSFLFHM